MAMNINQNYSQFYRGTTNVTEVTKKVVDSIISSELGIPLENSYSSFDMKA